MPLSQNLSMRPGRRQREAASFFGTYGCLGGVFPNVETLGYCRLSLRDRLRSGGTARGAVAVRMGMAKAICTKQRTLLPPFRTNHIAPGPPSVREQYRAYPLLLLSSTT
jgi:hypothetical protein